MNEDERYERLRALAEDVLQITRNSIILNLRFLDSALSRLDYQADPMFEFATDGEVLLYDPLFVVNRFVKDRNLILRDYVHSLFHCIFRHMYVHTLVDRDCWNLACDIAVEYSISQLGIDTLQSSRYDEQKAAFDQLAENGIVLTAEKLYRVLLDQDYTEEEMDYFRSLFHADDHTVWYMSRQGDDQTQTDSQQKQEGDKDSESDNQNNKDKGDSDSAEDGDGDDKENAPDAEPMSCEKDWENVSRRMQMELESFAQQGSKAGGLMQNLREVNREKYDYTRFLKKFAVLGEAMCINDDEFDYIYYTYGMDLYGDVPLVEPLEYKEVKRIREFVIAIDTSASTAGEPVQRFLTKTYNILQAEESFFRKINLHIIQCDAQIQQDVKITCREDFDRYLESMQLIGQGGTDFRPVFEYVEQLRARQELPNLKGLIYFTDGYGTFPERKPDYETAFVFLDDGYNNPELPPWAIKLMLTSEDL